MLYKETSGAYSQEYTYQKFSQAYLAQIEDLEFGTAPCHKVCLLKSFSCYGGTKADQKYYFTFSGIARKGTMI